MGKFKGLAIEQMEEDNFDHVMDEMHERNTIWAAVELCNRDGYGYGKFLDELQKALIESRSKV